MDALPEPSCFRAGLAALRAGRPEDAIPWLERAVHEAEAPELAALNLGFALMDTGRLAEARERLMAVRPHFEALPDWHLRVAHLAAMLRDWPAARAGFWAAVALAPGNTAARAGLAMTAQAEGDPVAAEGWLRGAIAIAPAEAELRRQLAEFLIADGRGEAATQAAAELLANPDAPPSAGAVHARALLAATDEAAARARLEAEAAADPFSAARAVALATLEEAAGRPEAALAQWRLAETLAPDDGEVLAALGRLLNAHGTREEARPYLERAIALRPLDLQPRVDLAQVHYRSFRLAEAERVYAQAIADFGRLPALLASQALVLASQGRQAEAAALADEIPARDPALGASIISGVAPYAPAQAGAAALHARALALKQALAADATDLDRRAEGPDRRLRIGFLSSAFGKHPVGWLTVAGIEGLPRTDFEVVLFSLRTLQAGIAQRFRARADRWVDLPDHLSDAELAARLRAAELDILVDLGGHGEGGRLRALRHRAAPVQMKWVGSQSAPTGVPHLDWMIADRWEIPESLDPCYTERALRLRDGYVCYAPPPYAPPVGPLPARRQGHVTFGCYNNLAKITPEVLGHWARILAALPRARLIIRNHALGDAGTREAFVNRAAALGLDPARLETHGPLAHEALLAAYNDIDISLDPFPYTGGLTVCESLWMGVPVVALAGEGFAGRHAVSHLSNAGLPDWVASTPDDYVALTLSRVADLAGLAALRGRLRAQVAASPLGDAPRFAESLALGLRAAWREACGALA